MSVSLFDIYQYQLNLNQIIKTEQFQMTFIKTFNN